MTTEALRDLASAHAPGEAPAVVAPPPGHPRFPLIDSLRGIAALLVVLTHSFIISGDHSRLVGTVALNAGSEVLAAFFLISAFVLYRPYVNAQINGARAVRTTDFLRRRLLRIVPCYWVALTLLAIYPGLSDVFSGNWWKYYFFLMGYDIHTVGQGLVVSWTLGIELTFYFVLPLYAGWIVRVTRQMTVARRVKIELSIFAAIAILSTLVRWIDYATGRTTEVQNSLVSVLYWLVLGMTLAVISAAVQAGVRIRVVRFVADHPAVCWGLALATLLLVCLLHPGPHESYSVLQWIFAYHVLGGLLAFFLMLPAVFGDAKGGWPRAVLAWPPLAWVGIISYGLYLWHVPLLGWLFGHGVRSFIPLYVAGVAVAVACSAASYYAIERPILRFKNRRPREIAPRAAPEPTAGRAV